MQEETSVRLMKHLVGVRLAQGMTQQLVRAMGVVKLGEKQRLAVIGPRHAAIAVFKWQFGNSATAQFFDKQAINLFTAGVQAVSKPLVIRADAECAQGNKPAIGQGVGVQQQVFGVFVDLLTVIGRARAAVMASVLIAGIGAGVVQIRPPRGGQ